MQGQTNSEQAVNWERTGEIFPGSGKHCRFTESTGFRWKLVLALIAGCAFLFVGKGARAESNVVRGDYDGDLRMLSSFCSGPLNAAESNYYLDMWSGRQLAAITRLNGLTNNHTLFINSHGQGGLGAFGNKYALLPHQALLKAGATAPKFSVRDVATVLGFEKVGTIRNVVVSSCDLESCFSAAEFRKHFPNATNIVHAARGQAGYQPMFFEALTNPSSTIAPLYESKHTDASGKARYELDRTSGPGSRKLSPYLAELYLPGASKPYRTQPAGRELLESQAPTLLARHARSLSHP